MAITPSSPTWHIRDFRMIMGFVWSTRGNQDCLTTLLMGFHRKQLHFPYVEAVSAWIKTISNWDVCLHTFKEIILLNSYISIHVLKFKKMYFYKDAIPGVHDFFSNLTDIVSIDDYHHYLMIFEEIIYKIVILSSKKLRYSK